MAFESAETVMALFAVVFATLAAIVYCLRILVLMERRVARIDTHIESLVKSVLREEVKIERAENIIEKQLKKR
jgi:hypothetical protein